MAVSGYGAMTLAKAQAQAMSTEKVAKVTVPHLDSKGVKWGKKALNVIGLVGMALVLPLTIVAACVYKVYTTHKLDATIENLAIRRFDAMQELRLPRLPIRDVDGYHAAIQNVDRLLKERPKKNVHAHMQKVREQIDIALRSRYYQKYKGNPDCARIRYIQKAAHLMTAHAPGMKEIEEYGSRFTQTPEGSIGYGSLANSLDKAVYDYSGFQKDNWIGKVFWSIAHPQKTLASFRGHSEKTALEYNSYRHGNANMHVADFTVGNMTMHLNLGPTPTADNLFEAHLMHLKHEGKGQRHLQQDVEFAGAKGEAQRRLKKKAIADENTDTLVYFSTPLDGKYWKGKWNYPNRGTAEGFFNSLWLNLEGTLQEMNLDPSYDNSFYIPDNALNSKEVGEVRNRSKKAFKALEDGEYFKALKAAGPDGLRRLDKVMLLGFEAMLAVKTILKMADAGPEEAFETFMGQACKQDIDRGVLLNVVTMLYMDALAGNEITKERVDQLVGMTLVRAGMVDDRAILVDRFEALSDFLHILSENPTAFMAQVKALNESDATVQVETNI